MKITVSAATNAVPPYVRATSTFSVRAKRQKATSSAKSNATATAKATVIPLFPPTCVPLIPMQAEKALQTGGPYAPPHHHNNTVADAAVGLGESAVWLVTSPCKI